jgi:CRP/FNR family transcriptional regulator, dissimilatory nitrate respiration regulator
VFHTPANDSLIRVKCSVIYFNVKSRDSIKPAPLAMSFSARLRAAPAEVLGKADFFRGLPSAALSLLASLCRVRTLGKHETLFLEQTRGSEVFFLAEGRIALQKCSPDGTPVTIRTVRPGEVFAEVVLFEQDRYPVTATAIVPATVVAFAKHDFVRLLDDRPFRDGFIANLMRKQRYLAERVRYLTSCDVEQRLFIFLKEQYGEVASISITISKKDVAAAIGATPETLSRLLQRLRADGSLRWERRTITLRPGFWGKFDAT